MVCVSGMMGTWDRKRGLCILVWALVVAAEAVDQMAATLRVGLAGAASSWAPSRAGVCPRIICVRHNYWVSKVPGD